jgi:hypothetical protein
MLHDLAKTCEHSSSLRRSHRAGPNTQLTTVPRLDPQAPCVPPVGWPQPNAPGRSPGSLASRPSLSRFDELLTVRRRTSVLHRAGLPPNRAFSGARPSFFGRSPNVFDVHRSLWAPRTLRRPPAALIHAPSLGSIARPAVWRTPVPCQARCYTPPSVPDAHRSPCGSTESLRRLTEPPFPCVAASQR